MRAPGKAPPPGAPAQGSPAAPRLLTPTDESLVVAIRDGDQEAFRQLYQRYAQAVYGRLTRLVGPTDEREDLVQQTFWRLHRALPRFRGDAPLSSFLHGIATRVAYETLRKRRRSPTYLVRDVDLNLMSDGPGDAEQLSMQRDRLHRSLALLDRLKPKQRIAFVLHAVEGLPLTEVADLTDSGPRTVGQRVSAARREIQRLLNQQEALGSSGGSR